VAPIDHRNEPLPLQRAVRMATAGVDGPNPRGASTFACITGRRAVPAADELVTECVVDELRSCSKVQQAWAWRCLCEFRSSSSPMSEEQRILCDQIWRRGSVQIVILNTNFGYD
jgi:hypothetical protein